MNEQVQALSLIRQAGGNTSEWATWAQRMAAWGMDPYKWPKPSEDAPQPSLSHLELLKKYMSHVRECEGVDFTKSLFASDQEGEFSQEEVELLHAISKEINRD